VDPAAYDAMRSYAKSIAMSDAMSRRFQGSIAAEELQEPTEETKKTTENVKCSSIMSLRHVLIDE
jgi:hypothetical protein